MLQKLIMFIFCLLPEGENDWVDTKVKLFEISLRSLTLNKESVTKQKRFGGRGENRIIAVNITQIAVT